MGGDSCSRALGFKSRGHILDGNDFFTLICCKNCIVGLKRPKINEKEAGIGPFFKKRKIKFLIKQGKYNLIFKVFPIAISFYKIIWQFLWWNIPRMYFVNINLSQLSNVWNLHPSVDQMLMVNEEKNFGLFSVWPVLVKFDEILSLWQNFECLQSI